ncbi:hypothetical protein Q5H93_12240 [Hymenobacter sp. ASUV-10]|uniref:Uncharacterized protein n=1 Tax=Hymenobacter aranciens TaxID=3063996 RepID=A0ABT9BB52_9BACT|nr:hypothetical protein [Hymenobacter sp. ASUV-10]MDO7875504.1 hypothetical protein [Hymenobacter sp. ASUV-10]
MADTVLFSESYGSVLVDEQVPCVITQWHGFANQQQFRALQGFALDYFEQRSTPARPWGWVGDVRQMSAIPQAVQEWLRDEFNPRATAAGLREVSVVLAESVLGQLATQQYADRTAQAVTKGSYELRTAYYPTLAEAKQGARQSLAQTAG